MLLMTREHHSRSRSQNGEPEPISGVDKNTLGTFVSVRVDKHKEDSDDARDGGCLYHDLVEDNDATRIGDSSELDKVVMAFGKTEYGCADRDLYTARYVMTY
jgi:hypothetical protein